MVRAHQPRGLLLLVSILCTICADQAPARNASHEIPPIVKEARAYRMAHEKSIIREFADLLAIPNIARDEVHIRENAEWIVRQLQMRGVTTRLLEAEHASPVVFGELKNPRARHTVTFYAHYDGQPVIAAQWTGAPFTPVLRDATLEAGGKPIDLGTLPESLDPTWRLYARSAGDDKAPIIGMLAALDALKAAGRLPSVNLKFFFEGEEEAGSPHLAELLARYGALLDTDLWVLCDGPVHQSGRQLVFFGARGQVHLDMTVFGPNRGLHSGAYGNWAPNPISLLIDLLDGMRDLEAHILIPGFYDDVRPLSAAESAAIQAMPDQESQLKRVFGIARSEGEPARLESRVLEPALNVVGIQSGSVGADSANVISSEAVAALDFRLVPDQTPDTVRRRVEQYIEGRGFHVVHEPPDAVVRMSHARIVLLQWDVGYPPQRTPMDSAVAEAFVRAVESTIGQEVLKVPALGGSVPMYLFAGLSHVPVIGLPIANYDDNQHTSNENIRLQNLWDGIEIYAGLFANLGTMLPMQPRLKH